MFTRYTSAKMLFEEAKQAGLSPRWETPCGLLSFAGDDRTVFVYYTKLDCNSQLGSQICQDKSLTRAFLNCEGLPSIPSCYAKQESEINRFFDQYHPLIQKPLLGMKSQGVRLISKREEIDFSNIEDTIFEQYIDATEYRCLVLHETIAVQKKTLDPTEKYPWRKHIANVQNSEWPGELTAVAESIVRSLSMTFLAVDFLVDAQGKTHVLELNAMPGLHSFHHPDAGEPVNVAQRLLGLIRTSGR